MTDAAKLGQLSPVVMELAERELLVGESDVPFRRWVQVAKIGHQHLMGDKPFDFADKDAARVVELFGHFKANDKRVIFDWNHGSASAAASPESQGKAGVVLELDHRKGLGIWALGEFTDRAAALIKSGDIDQTSPEIWSKVRNLETGEVENGPAFMAIALTARPQLTGLEILAASDLHAALASRYGEDKARAAVSLLCPTTDDDRGDPVETPEETRHMSEIKNLADAQARIAELEAAAASVADTAPVIEAVGDNDADAITRALALAEAAGDLTPEALTQRLSESIPADVEIEALRATVNTLSEANATAAAEKAQTEAVALVAKFERSGQVTPAQRDFLVKQALSDAAGAEAYMRTLPVVVNLSEGGSANGGGEPVGAEEAPTTLDGAVKLALSEAAAKGEAINYAQALSTVMASPEGIALAAAHAAI